MTTTASVLSASNAIAIAYTTLKSEGIDLKEVHGDKLQWAIVRALPRMTQEETLSSLTFLSSLKEGTTEYISLRNSIVEGNLYFAYTIASKYEKMIGGDAYSLASIGLMNAITDYAKNGNGDSFLSYAKAVIAHAIQRNGITPSVKCGIKGGLNPLNKKHNAETNRKRAEKGLDALMPVLVTSAEVEERKDDDGKLVNLFDIIPSEEASPLEALEKSEDEAEKEEAIASVISRFDAISQKIWQLRTENGMEWTEIGKQVGMKHKACQMRFYTIQDKIKAAIA